jgi:hypothetical protein
VTEVVVPLTAPTAVQGYVDPYALGDSRYSSLYMDLLEHVPDLTFPLSIPVYARMRKDPKLAAIEAGWVLNLLRAQWQLDPAGCRDEVVKAVADGLGIPVMGDDEPGPARLRGVSWGDHLRAALRMIPFGFSPFEIQADTSSGQAKLAGLWERPPWTIWNIRVDGKTGLLTGADQNAVVGDVPELPAQNLAWYVRGREGANWAGQSLFRASYASWLIKEEVRRHYGAANVRWSMGVPVMEALPGTNPTPQQMAEAQQMASAARGGITAGAASPPGFTLKIAGITGSLPDSQSFLQWLDQQMSASALLGVLDLGQTATGSRALGDTFLDVFHLALEAEATMVADTATRQIAARIVDWNYGEDEPVPQVVVSGVGSQRETTAESLNLLLSSGALGADPALEAWVRREYKLPDRDPKSPFEVKAPKGQFMQVPGGESVAADGEAAKQIAASKGRSRARRTPSQPTLFDDGDGEVHAAAAEDPDAVLLQQQWEQERQALLAQWPATAQPMVDELSAQAQTAVKSGDLGALGGLAVSAGVIAALAAPLTGSGTKLAKLAAAGVVAEAAGAHVSLDVPADAGAERVRQTADAVAQIIARGYASGAAKASLQLAGADPADVKAEVARQLADLGTSKNGLVGDNISALLSASQFAGRLAVLEQHPAKLYVATEVNDPNECVNCRKVDGREYQTLRQALTDYPGGGHYRECLGRGRCRGDPKPIF